MYEGYKTITRPAGSFQRDFPGLLKPLTGNPGTKQTPAIGTCEESDNIILEAMER